MQLSTEVSNRIAMLRPILIIGVVFLHVSGVPYLASETQPGMFNWLAAFFKNGVFRGTVPTMSLIAGFLLFSSGLDRAPRKLVEKKFKTLVIPYIVFNVYCFVFMATMHANFDTAFPNMAAYRNMSGSMFSYLFGIVDAPNNAPLHFVRDLMVFVMLAPLLGVFLRHSPWIGLCFLTVFFGMNFDGPLVIRSSSLILFYIGGAAAVYKWNVLALDRYAMPSLFLFTAACVGMVCFRIDNNDVLVMVAPFLIWPAASLLTNTKIEKWAIGFSAYSFFIFAAHIPILDTTWWFVKQYAYAMPYPIYWISAPIFVVALLKYIYDFSMKVTPQAFNFVIGARAVRQRHVDRRRAARPRGAPIYSPEMRLSLSNS